MLSHPRAGHARRATLRRQWLLGGAAWAAWLLAGLACAQDAVAPGFRLMVSMSGGNCLACHALPGQAGIASTFGPSLQGVGRRYNAEELRQWVSDARKIRPDTLMPPFGTTEGTHMANRTQAILNAEEIGLIVAALQTFR